MIGEAIELVGKIPYGEGHLSKAVQLQRLIDKKKNGNYASALLDDGTTLVAHADSTPAFRGVSTQSSGGQENRGCLLGAGAV